MLCCFRPGISATTRPPREDLPRDNRPRPPRPLPRTPGRRGASIPGEERIPRRATEGEKARERRRGVARNRDGERKRGRERESELLSIVVVGRDTRRARFGSARSCVATESIRVVHACRSAAPAYRPDHPDDFRISHQPPPSSQLMVISVSVHRDPCEKGGTLLG